MRLVLAIDVFALLCYAVSDAMFFVAYVRSRHPHLILMILWVTCLAISAALRILLGC
jgi:hypothetical protein